jgi:putative ABC transport system permease protein
MTRVRDSVAQIPGVAGAALASAGPLFGGEEVGTMAITGRPAAADQEPTVRWFDVDPGFFSTLGIPLRRGRGFTAADRDGAPAVAIVNQALATRLFPGEDPLGREISVERHPATIVGIVADVRPLRPDEATAPEVYWPIAQFPRGGAYLVIRTASGVAGLRDAVQARVAAVHPDIQLSAFTTIEERLARRLNSPRFNMLLVGAFALVAMLLAAVGVYGVAAYTVTTRTREFAVRMAIGSTPGQLVRGVLAAGARVAGVGIGLGAVGALLLGRTLTAMLYGVPAADPLSLAAAIVLLGGISLQAMWLPARRASRIDPSLALRGL